MSQANAYRIKAAELHAKARREGSPAARAELAHLAQAYLRLAEHADRNSGLDVVYETPSAPPQSNV